MRPTAPHHCPFPRPAVLRGRSCGLMLGMLLEGRIGSLGCERRVVTQDALRKMPSASRTWSAPPDARSERGQHKRRRLRTAPQSACLLGHLRQCANQVKHMLLVLAFGAEGSPGWRTALQEGRRKEGSECGSFFWGGGRLGKGRKGCCLLEAARDSFEIMGFLGCNLLHISRNTFGEFGS